MASVRDVILQACSRVNLGSKTQPPAPNVFEAGLEDLHSIVNKYNADDLLVFTQNSARMRNNQWIHIYDKVDSLKGENNLFFDSAEDLNEHEITQEEYENDTWAMVTENPIAYYTIRSIHVGDTVEYSWVGHPVDKYDKRCADMSMYAQMEHVHLNNLFKIKSLYFKPTDNPGSDFYRLDYVNHSDFNRYGENTFTYTYTEKAQGEWLIELKPIPSRLRYDLSIDYNEGFDFDVDSDLYIPDNYVELLITTLAYKLSVRYPRLDEAQMARLERDVGTMIDNVKTPKSDQKGLLRSDYWNQNRRMTAQELLAGTWF
jgi:hypothetical protein